MSAPIFYSDCFDVGDCDDMSVIPRGSGTSEMDAYDDLISIYTQCDENVCDTELDCCDGVVVREVSEGLFEAYFCCATTYEYLVDEDEDLIILEDDYRIGVE